MRAALYLLAALAAAVYHLAQGSFFLAFALLLGVALFPVARWYSARTTPPHQEDRQRSRSAP